MRTFSAWRAAGPGPWLAAALIADIAAYATAAEWSGGMPWLVLDLWLVLRVWRGGATALKVFLALQVSTVALFASALVASRWNVHIETTAGPDTVALFAVAAWCLLAPALSRHVSAPDRAVGLPDRVSIER